MDAAIAEIWDLADRDRGDVKVMVVEPLEVPFDRAIVGDGDIGACGRYPRRQQPQVMTELAGERRGCVIVCTVCQRQVMFGIEKIDVHYLLDGDVEGGFEACCGVGDGEGHYARIFTSLADND